MAEGQATNPTDADIQALGDKLEQFALALPAGEQTALLRLLAQAAKVSLAEADLQGYGVQVNLFPLPGTPQFQQVFNSAIYINGLPAVPAATGPQSTASQARPHG